MKKIAVVGTGYVGLVTGVALSEIGHHVTCIDIDEAKVARMQKGESPIYEPGLDEMMTRNIEAGRLHFTTIHQEGFVGKDVAYIAVGTPELEDGTADLRFIESVAKDIAKNITSGITVVTKSTVPVGTNDYILGLVNDQLVNDVKVEIVSNPEFLREGSAIYDAFNGDRIVIGSDSEKAATLLEEINKPFGIHIYKTDVRSAEMIKYAANAFLATKITYINEISNLCERLGANIVDVAKGIGLDDRIGKHFLRPGIGYGGSCFPKDTSALVKIAKAVDYDFNLLQAVIHTNEKQQTSLVDKAEKRFGSLEGKRVALLGLAFKPNTDDMREAPSIAVSQRLIESGASVVGYDPIAIDNARRILPGAVEYASSVEEAVKGSDIVFILTEWDEVKALDLSLIKDHTTSKTLFDGRNCFDLDTVKEANIEYHSMGRVSVERVEILV
ncbi:UDP-glucose dehydrogenase family protein [Salipaludibacillus sp. CF4.18]|uniref:UDP-glucose dehydrogenase family protein n=1 Tax=Salipaludibacillus sp. CF4.18 TaxID=3373081 RepID=UPI003EE6C140